MVKESIAVTGDLQQEVGDRCQVEGGAVTGAVAPHVRYGHTVTLAALGREQLLSFVSYFCFVQYPCNQCRCL